MEKLKTLAFDSAEIFKVVPLGNHIGANQGAYGNCAGTGYAEGQGADAGLVQRFLVNQARSSDCRTTEDRGIHFIGNHITKTGSIDRHRSRTGHTYRNTDYSGLGQGLQINLAATGCGNRGTVQDIGLNSIGNDIAGKGGIDRHGTGGSLMFTARMLAAGSMGEPARAVSTSLLFFALPRFHPLRTLGAMSWALTTTSPAA